MQDHWQMLYGLYRDSPCPVLRADSGLTVLWANQAAISRYPVLSLPGGLSLLFSREQLEEIKNFAAPNAAHTIELGGITKVGFCFAPVGKEGYFVSIGPLEEGWERPADQSADFLAATITNQLKSPLSNIFSSLFAMARLPEAEPGSRLSELIEQVNRNSYQMLRFSLDFNAYLQDTLGNRRFHPEMLDLGALLTQLGEAAGMLTRAVKIPLRLSLPDAPVYIEADERRLSHALLHIISNCCRFTQEENEIEILLETNSGHAKISISDCGSGIPEKLLDRVCDPFFSYDPEGIPYGGSGLGLSVARQVVAQHGGSFAITSAEGKGTTVAIGLPLAETDKLILRSPEPVVDLLRDRFSLVHIILSDSCGVPKP